MRSKKIGFLLGGWLLSISLAACNQVATPALVETAPEATLIPQSKATINAVMTATTEPTSTLSTDPTQSAQPSLALGAPVGGVGTETPPIVETTSPTTPTRRLQLTAIPLTPAEIIQEEKVTDAVTPIPTPTDRGLQKLVVQAKEDLAKRLGLSVDQIDLIELKFVLWPDKGLGCPQPGMAYLQVPEDGALIRLSDGQRVYNYHVGAGRPPFLCEQATQ